MWKVAIALAGLSAFVAFVSPGRAQEVIIQEPSTAAANHAAGAAHWQRRDANADAAQARHDRGVANADAAHGNYGGAAAAEDAAHRAEHGYNVHTQAARHDANAAHQDDTTRIQIVP